MENGTGGRIDVDDLVWGETWISRKVAGGNDSGGRIFGVINIWEENSRGDPELGGYIQI